MPIWVIVAVAVLIVLGGASWPTVLGLRRRRRRAFGVAVADVRARIEALDYRIDTLSTTTAAGQAAELRDSARAILSVADDEQSAAGCRRADEVAARAETALADSDPQSGPAA